jgi:hypothetical protein
MAKPARTIIFFAHLLAQHGTLSFLPPSFIDQHISTHFILSPSASSFSSQPSGYLSNFNFSLAIFF